MEQTRVFLAILLSLIVISLWATFFAPEPVKHPPTSTEQTKPVENASQDVKQPPEKATSEVPPLPQVPATLSRPPQVITVKTSLYTAKISEQGAVFKSFIMNHYKETIQKDSPLKEIIVDNDFGTMQLGFSNMDFTECSTAVYQADTQSKTLTIEQHPVTLHFTWITPQGLRVVKAYTFKPESYLVGLSVTLSNDATTKSFKDSMYLNLTNKVDKRKSRYGFTGPCALLDQKLEQIKVKDDDISPLKGNIQWVAYQDRYFMDSIIPSTNMNAEVQVHKKENDFVQTKLITPPLEIDPGKHQSFQFQIFMGPESVDLLQSIGHNLDMSVDFGWFSFLAKPFLALMKLTYKHAISNYGIAIIILTILIKLILWPLGTKSYKSMNDMKKLQPIMAEIREKYKDDKRKMNEEIMGLYKTYKINPMGGCLPMIAQIPIFFAFYRMLYGAFELRHAPFFSWINDLSAPDRLFHFNITIPYMQPPYGIPVLTIIMGASMLIQQKISPPTGGDPTQAKMMMFMPIIFTVIFINLPSGLVLYWLVNNLLSIGQQYYISKKYA